LGVIHAIPHFPVEALFAQTRRTLWCRPTHDRHSADAVLRAARDNPIAVGNVDQHTALAVEETHDLKRLEYKAAVFVEDALAVLDFANDLNRPDLATRDTGVTRILRQAYGAFHASGLGPGDVAGDTLDFGVVEAIDHDLVIGADPSKIRADRAGRPAFGAADDPPSEDHDDEEDYCADNHPDPFYVHADSPFLGEADKQKLFASDLFKSIDYPVTWQRPGHVQMNAAAPGSSECVHTDRPDIENSSMVQSMFDSFLTPPTFFI
jgi:hypothetical protein